jgi:hypothetical protein
MGSTRARDWLPARRVFDAVLTAGDELRQAMRTEEKQSSC